MRTGCSNLMVIVLQDVGTGLIKSTEAYGFIKSHSRDDIDDNELRLLHLSLLSYIYISSFHGAKSFIII